MSQKSPTFEFFDILQQNMLIKPKGSPFYIFRHYAAFSERKKFKNVKFFLKKVFCAFWALDIAPTLDVPVLFLFQLTISLWMVHFFTIFRSFVQLIFWEAGDRGFDFRTKLQIFYASKSRGETKGAPFGFFSALCDFFSKIFEFYQRPPLHIFWSFKNV